MSSRAREDATLAATPPLTEAAPPDPRAAPSAPPRVAGLGPALALGLGALIVVLDQLSKAAITARYAPCGNPNYYPVFGSHAGFSYVCNSGTAFSRFSGTPLVWLPVLIAFTAVLWLWRRSLERPRLAQQFAFGLIIGGAFGNLIDRARLGYVVDFVDLRLTDTLRFYVFNVADSAITIGVVVLAVFFWRSAPSPPPVN